MSSPESGMVERVRRILESYPAGIRLPHREEAGETVTVAEVLSVLRSSGGDMTARRLAASMVALRPFAEMVESLEGAPDGKLMSNTRIHPPLYARDFRCAHRVLNGGEL